jgi:hypothetical protein
MSGSTNFRNLGSSGSLPHPLQHRPGSYFLALPWAYHLADHSHYFFYHSSLSDLIHHPARLFGTFSGFEYTNTKKEHL